MRLFLVRHGDPRPDGGGLTPEGDAQALALAEAFGRLGLDAIFTSPLERARATARPTAAALGLVPVEQSWMAEPEWIVDMPPSGRRSAWNLAGEVLRSDGYTLPRFVDDGLAGIGLASDAFLRDLGYERVGRRYRVASGHAGKVAVVAHLGFGLTWLAHLLELPLRFVWSGFWLDPGSITTVHLEQRSADWAVPRCLSVGATGHLDARGLAPSPSSIHAKFL